MFRIALLTYSALYSLALLLYLPVLLYRGLFQGKRWDLRQRLGWIPIRQAKSDSDRPIWIHAVSVGEVNAIRTLLDELATQGHRLLVTTTTDTGQQLAQRLFSEKAYIFYFPLDWRLVCQRVLRQVQPKVVLLAETELWPNFLAAAAERGFPVALINGRLSDRSFRHYRRVRFLLSPLLKGMACFCMQSKQDKERILDLGAPAEKVHWVGNLKYETNLPAPASHSRLRNQVAQILGVPNGALIWVCGSTREGEEKVLVTAFCNLRQDYPMLRLVVAPRHPHRGLEVSHLLEEFGLRQARRSEIQNLSADAALDCLVLDSIGELASLYEIADFVFVGGSLVAHGGQNILEPAALGKPILFGPHMENFREISRTFLQGYAAVQVSNGAELEEKLRYLIQDKHARSWLGRRARAVIGANQGALQQTLKILALYFRKGEE